MMVSVRVLINHKIRIFNAEKADGLPERPPENESSGEWGTRQK
jgi:hypothetical protein